MKYTQPTDVNQNPLGYQLSTVNVLDDDLIPLNSRIYSIEVLIKDVLDYIDEILEELAVSGNVMDFYTRMTHRIEDMLNTIAEIQVALSNLKTSGAIITNGVDGFSNTNQLDPILNSFYSTLTTLKSTLASESSKAKSHIENLSSNVSSLSFVGNDFNQFYREVEQYMLIDLEEAESEVESYTGIWRTDTYDISRNSLNQLQKVSEVSVKELNDMYNILMEKIYNQADLGSTYAAKVGNLISDKYVWLLDRVRGLEKGVDTWLSTKKPVSFPSSSVSFGTVEMKTLSIS